MKEAGREKAMYRYNLGLRFEAIVETCSRNTALKYPDAEAISYDALNRRSNQLARYLLDMGIRQQDVVGISGEKQANTYAGMLACLKIGAIYTMFDPDSPQERLRKIFSTCSPRVLLVGPTMNTTGLGEQHGRTVVRKVAAELDKALANYSDGNLEITRDVVGNTPAYIMYTSGSTGIPKGAVMTHENLLNLVDWSVDAFNITPSDVLTNVNPLYFDNSVYDFYSALFSGACLVPFSKGVVSNAEALLDAIDRLECTSWFSVPSLLMFLQTMKAFRRGNMKSIKRIIFGGEGYPKSKLKQLYDTYADRIDFFNVYGPTECTCICSSCQVTEDDFADLQGFLPLGTLIPNFSYLILDDTNEKVCDKEIGELCLLGPNVGLGYYNDPTRTHASFMQNPYNPNYPEAMYKTGDLVRYSPDDDKLYILGRKDNQIKHMGYRIELEEIETAISRLDYVSQASVVHNSDGQFSQIVAIVGTRNGIVAADVRKDLRRMLPSYMIPSLVHIVEELPKNANGKVDRRKLVETYAG